MKCGPLYQMKEYLLLAAFMIPSLVVLAAAIVTVA
jgi:hypothetical protein